jgi:hypothetical protein
MRFLRSAADLTREVPKEERVKAFKYGKEQVGEGTGCKECLG